MPLSARPITTLLVYLIGTLAGGRINPVRLTLAGVAIGAVLLGITTGLSLIDPQTFDQLRFWQAGTLDIRTLSTLPVTAPAILLGCLLTLLIARPLNTIGMGEDLAIALGARVVLTQIVAVIAITLLCGAATATVGSISFIGLMVPHIARWWVSRPTLDPALFHAAGADFTAVRRRGRPLAGGR